jgi:hypothetical protein
MSEKKSKNTEKKLPAKTLRADVFSAVAFLGGGRTSDRAPEARKAAVARVKAMVLTSEGAKLVHEILEKMKDKGKEDQQFWEQQYPGIQAIEDMIRASSVPHASGSYPSKQ